MRIIAGWARGRVLKGPSREGIRPTADRVREAIFNILGQWLDGLTILDLFAGTGAMALEALSRGAKSAVLVDHSRESISICKENIDQLEMSNLASVVCASVAPATLEKLRKYGSFDLIFADPPYRHSSNDVLNAIASVDLLNKNGRLVIEHDKRVALPGLVTNLELREDRRFGDTVVSFYRKNCE